jgi:hypothetical protein
MAMQAERDEKDKQAAKLRKAAEAAAKKLTELEREQANVAEKEKHLQVSYPALLCDVLCMTGQSTLR